MDDLNMKFLDPVGRLSWNDNRNIAQRCYCTAAFAQQSDDLHPFSLCGLRGQYQIFAIARGCDRKEDIVFLAESIDHPLEHVFESVIVRRAGEVRRIAECQRRHWFSVLTVPAGPLFGEVHSIAMAPAV